jgi:hypothetical protein
MLSYAAVATGTCLQEALLTAFWLLLCLLSLLLLLLLLLQVKFKLGKINAKDDSIRGLHRLLFNRDGTVSSTHTG